jgi:hypothetical protein
LVGPWIALAGMAGRAALRGFVMALTFVSVRERPPPE